MSEWWSYRPADFLMFSPRIYWRLFESLNAAAWPAQPLVVGAALAGIAGMARRAGPIGQGAARGALCALALAWLAVAGWFLAPRYAPINWAATYATVAFALQALGLLGLAAIGGVAGHAVAPRRRVGWALLLWALCLHPLLAWAAGRPWTQAEVFGLAPDPTAIATLGALLLLRGQTAVARWLGRLLWPVPVLWCLASAATLWTMGSALGWVPFAAAVVGCLALFRR